MTDVLQRLRAISSSEDREHVTERKFRKQLGKDTSYDVNGVLKPLFRYVCKEHLDKDDSPFLAELDALAAHG